MPKKTTHTATAGGSIPRLSLSMIVKNEEKFLSDCLKSVRDFVDEIVVVDTGSTDRTIEIARRYGAVVYSFSWCDDFSAARNTSLQHCTGKWILYLDADERLRISGGGRDALHRLLNDESVIAYMVSIQSGTMHGDGSSVHTAMYPRLFRNHHSIRFEGRVHEQILPSLERRGGNIKNSQLLIEHLGYDQGAIVIRNKCLRNISLLEAEIAQHPENANLRYQLGNTYVVLGEYKLAEDILIQSLESPMLKSNQKAFIYALLAEAALRQNHPLAAIAHCKKSIEYAPSQQGACWILANAYSVVEDYAAAAQVLRIMIAECGQRKESTIEADIRIPAETLYESLGECHVRSGDFEQAADVFHKAFALYPHSKKLKNRLTEASHILKNPDMTQQYAALIFQSREAYRNGNPTKALELVHVAIALQPKKEDAYIEAAQLCIGMSMETEAVKIFEAAVSQEITSARFHKQGIDLYLRCADIAKAIAQADRLAFYIPASAVEPIKQRLLKLSSMMVHTSTVE